MGIVTDFIPCKGRIVVPMVRTLRSDSFLQVLARGEVKIVALQKYSVNINISLARREEDDRLDKVNAAWMFRIWSS